MTEIKKRTALRTLIICSIITVLIVLTSLISILVPGYLDSNKNASFDNTIKVDANCSTSMPINSVNIFVKNTSNSENSFNHKLVYEFNVDKPVGSYMVDTGINAKGTIDRNQNKSEIIVNLNETSTPPSYQNIRGSDLSIIYPSVSIVFDPKRDLVDPDSDKPIYVNVAGNGDMQKYKFEDYRRCIESVESDDGKIRGFIENSRIILRENSENPRVYKIESDISKRSTYVAGQINRHKLSHIVNILETAGSYENTFVNTRYIKVYPVRGMDFRGQIINSNKSKSVVYLEEKYIQSNYNLVGHEWVHTYQNFRAKSNFKWWTEGSAEYIGAVITNDSGSSEPMVRSQAFNNGINLFKSNNAKMSHPETWENGIQYTKGAKIAYLVDLSLRHHSDDKNILDLIKNMNERDKVSHKDSKNMIRKMTDREFAKRYSRIVKEESPVKLKEELDEMDVSNTEVKLPHTFHHNEYEITECSYNDDVAVIDECN